jgi:SNF family Na+-dependent transporter
MYIAFFECVAVLWIYGTKRMSANIKDMTGSYPNIIYRVCWRYISPLLIFVS